VQGGTRRDELESTGHYKYWRTDFDLCNEVGAPYVRYGIPYYKTHIGPHRYDWSFPDEVLPVMKEKGLIPIMDLCHFGVPDWVGSFQNTDWPILFADYVEAFVERYPWVTYFTPVNEILVCARLSCQKGYWNEQQKSDRAFVRALANMCRASIEAAWRILKHQPGAVFFQSEIAEILHERSPQTRAEVDFKNQLRFISFDLLYGSQPQARILEFLLDCGLSMDEFHWFMDHGQDERLHCIMGTDYYAQNERYIDAQGEEDSSGPVLGWAQLAEQYFRRYRKPIMLTETNFCDRERAPEWLWTIWHNVDTARRNGIPVVGLTWFSLQDQVDWDIQLREIRGKVNPNGLYDYDRKPNPVARTFTEISKNYGNAPLVADFAMGGIHGPGVDRPSLQSRRPTAV
ncbi:MAG: family 1 glycosylhydrolase, partial [Chloroflexi bacterium]|nr:family 1 glycosylhydrolase [Chloroflexota bacterium]